jgi:hypothetical protein
MHYFLHDLHAASNILNVIQGFQMGQACSMDEGNKKLIQNICRKETTASEVAQLSVSDVSAPSSSVITAYLQGLRFSRRWSSSRGLQGCDSA